MTDQRSVVGIVESPFFSLLDSTIFILFPVISDTLIERVIKIWSSHQWLDGEEDSSDLEGWWPLVLQDIKADSTKLINIWVVDFGSEKNLWSNHWILIREEEFTGEQSSFIRSLGWTSNLNKEMSEIGLVWLGVDSDNRVLGKSLCFFENSWWNRHCFFWFISYIWDIYYNYLSTNLF
mgnify:CR=1 FL=1